MSFFHDVRTCEELKRQWRGLVKVYHPDLGGSDEDMRQINLEYDQLLRRVGNIHEGQDGKIWEDSKGPKDRYTCDINDLDDGFRDVVLNVLKMEGIEVLLVGSWIWLEGETKPWKEALKQIGLSGRATARSGTGTRAADDSAMRTRVRSMTSALNMASAGQWDTARRRRNA